MADFQIWYLYKIDELHGLLFEFEFGTFVHLLGACVWEREFKFEYKVHLAVTNFNDSIVTNILTFNNIVILICSILN